MTDSINFRSRASNYSKFKDWIFKNCKEWEACTTGPGDFPTFELNGIAFHILPGTSRDVSEYIIVAYLDDRDDSEIAHILNLTRQPEYKDEHILVNNHDAADMLGHLMHTAELANDLEQSLPQNRQISKRFKPIKI